MKRLILTIIYFSICLSVLPTSAESRKVVGWLEMVRIYPGNLKMRAKLDTGAKSSSINVYNLKKFESNGERWVSFELREARKDKKGKSATFEKKVIDSVKIKKKGGGIDKRVVVKMDICIAGIYKEIEMSLADRSNFNYQILIGRTNLEKDFIVDPSNTFTHQPDCKVPVELNPQKQG